MPGLSAPETRGVATSRTIDSVLAALGLCQDSLAVWGTAPNHALAHCHSQISLDRLILPEVVGAQVLLYVFLFVVLITVSLETGELRCLAICDLVCHVVFDALLTEHMAARERVELRDGVLLVAHFTQLHLLHP